MKRTYRTYKTANSKLVKTWHDSNIPAEKNGSPSTADKPDGRRFGPSCASTDRAAASIPADIPS